MKIVKNGKIIMNDEIVEGSCLLFDKKIIGICDEKTLNIEDDIEIIDAKGRFISPGLIDIRDVDELNLKNLDLNDINNIEKELASVGVTSYISTVVDEGTDLKNGMNLYKMKLNKESFTNRFRCFSKFLGVRFKVDSNDVSEYLLKEYKDVIKLLELNDKNDIPSVLGRFYKRVYRYYPNIITPIIRSIKDRRKLVDTIRAVTHDAANLLDVCNKGGLDIGKDADIIIFDENGVYMTILEGNIIYQKYLTLNEVILRLKKVSRRKGKSLLRVDGLDSTFNKYISKKYCSHRDNYKELAISVSSYVEDKSKLTATKFTKFLKDISLGVMLDCKDREFFVDDKSNMVFYDSLLGKSYYIKDVLFDEDTNEIVFDCEENFEKYKSGPVLKEDYVLKWCQKDKDLHVVYGEEEFLLEKANELAEREDVVFVSLDRVHKIIKDVR